MEATHSAYRSNLSFKRTLIKMDMHRAGVKHNNMQRQRIEEGMDAAYKAYSTGNTDSSRQMSSHKESPKRSGDDPELSHQVRHRRNRPVHTSEDTHGREQNWSVNTDATAAGVKSLTDLRCDWQLAQV